jgi:hypothetical protein
MGPLKSALQRCGVLGCKSKIANLFHIEGARVDCLTADLPAERVRENHAWHPGV